MRFDELHLQPGAQLKLKPLGVEGVEIAAKYVGVYPPYSVLASLSAGDAKRHIVEGTKLNVTALTATGVVHFDADVQVIVEEPFHYVHLSFPTDLEVENIRAVSRVRAQLPITAINLCDDEHMESINGRLLDISPLGARISMDGDLGEVDDDISVCTRIIFTGVDKRTTFGAVIRSKYVKPVSEALPFTFGIEFVDLSENKQLLLNGFVFYQQQKLGTISY